MKTLIVALLMAGMVISASAQSGGTAEPDTLADKKNAKDSTVVHVGNVKVTVKSRPDNKSEVEISMDTKHEKDQIIVEDAGDDTPVVFNKKKELSNVKTRWMLLELGVSAYGTGLGSFDTPDEYSGLDLNYGKSINVNLHIFRQRVNIIQHHLNLMYGLALEFDNYRFSKNYTLMPDTNRVITVGIPEKIVKSKLAATYLNLPIMLNFETYPEDLDKSFRINIGGYAGLLLEAHTKIKFADGSKVKDRDNFNLNKFRYGVTGMIGYGWFNLYANYSLEPFFADGVQPELYPFNVGVVLIGF